MAQDTNKTISGNPEHGGAGNPGIEARGQGPSPGDIGATPRIREDRESLRHGDFTYRRKLFVLHVEYSCPVALFLTELLNNN